VAVIPSTIGQQAEPRDPHTLRVQLDVHPGGRGGVHVVPGQIDQRADAVEPGALKDHGVGGIELGGVPIAPSHVDQDRHPPAVVGGSTGVQVHVVPTQIDRERVVIGVCRRRLAAHAQDRGLVLEVARPGGCHGGRLRRGRSEGGQGCIQGGRDERSGLPDGLEVHRTLQEPLEAGGTRTRRSVVRSGQRRHEALRCLEHGGGISPNGSRHGGLRRLHGIEEDSDCLGQRRRFRRRERTRRRGIDPNEARRRGNGVRERAGGQELTGCIYLGELLSIHIQRQEIAAVGGKISALILDGAICAEGGRPHAQEHCGEKSGGD
jgi:hypothetical protein